MSPPEPPAGHEPITAVNYGVARPPVEGPEPVPAPGTLNIKERRSWKTWQLATAMLVAALIGMLLNYRTVPATASANSGSYSLPPAAGSGSTTTTTITGAAGGATTSTTTSVPDSSTTSTTASSSSSSTTSTVAVATEPAQLLLPSTQMEGNWTSPSFATTQPGWNIGWAFRCTPAPTAGPSFEVFVTPAGTPPSGTPAIDESGASGQSVTAQSTIGQQTLVVQAPANCEWVVKVTGN